MQKFVLYIQYMEYGYWLYNTYGWYILLQLEILANWDVIFGGERGIFDPFK